MVTDMNRYLHAMFATLAFASPTCLGDAPVPNGHSTVHVVFITSHTSSMMGGNKPMARVGDAIVPVGDIHPIRITIDGSFVGHAMVGPWDLKPIFVLSEGKHKFTFAIEGFDPVSADITVLGTGSKQYLIAKLPSSDPSVKNTGVSTDASTVQPFDN